MNGITGINNVINAVVPTTLLVVLNVICLTSNNRSGVSFRDGFFPSFAGFSGLILTSDVFLFCTNVRVNNVRIGSIRGPSIGCPGTIFVNTLVAILVFILKAFTLNVVVPRGSVGLARDLLINFSGCFGFVRTS